MMLRTAFPRLSCFKKVSSSFVAKRSFVCSSRVLLCHAADDTSKQNVGFNGNTFDQNNLKENDKGPENVNFNIDEMILNTSTTEEETFDSDESESYFESDDSIANQILEVALTFVPQYGWSNKSIEEAMKALDISETSTGMFKRQGADLVLYFLDECNNSLAEQLSELQYNKDGDKYKLYEFIEAAMQLRLKMNIPYIDSWHQAMILLASPSVATDCLESSANMIDEIWYHAGDLSVGIDWYTKRLVLAGVYAATELHMLNDKSANFEKTWDFLHRRMNEVKAAEIAKNSIENSLNDVVSLASAGATTARNIFGLNEKTR